MSFPAKQADGIIPVYLVRSIFAIFTPDSVLVEKEGSTLSLTGHMY